MGGCVYHLSLNSLRRYCELGLKAGIADDWCSCDIVDLVKALSPGLSTTGGSGEGTELKGRGQYPLGFHWRLSGKEPICQRGDLV